MTIRLSALAAVAALLVMPAGVAFGAKAGPGSPAPSRFTTYLGSDRDGPVSFKLYTDPPTPVHRGATLVIESFHFANRCSRSGTTVTEGIPVNSHHAFAIDRANPTIRKIVSGSLRGKGYVDASGKARVVTYACDSGPLKFTVKKRS